MSKHTLGSIVLPLLVLAAFTLCGCTEEAPDAPDETASAASESPSIMRTDREARGERRQREMPTKDQVPIPSDFDEEAESAVTAESYRERLAELDTEIPDEEPEEASAR